VPDAFMDETREVTTGRMPSVCGSIRADLEVKLKRDRGTVPLRPREHLAIDAVRTD